jgi:HPt (histidine-containing phosphotransfer) domain-containing protein
LLAACGDDAEALGARCQDLQAYLPGRLAEVSDALRNRDTARLREAAHKLCGIVSVFSTVAASVASNLQDEAADGRLNGSGQWEEQLQWMARELLRRVDGLSIEALRRGAKGATSAGPASPEAAERPAPPL